MSVVTLLYYALVAFVSVLLVVNLLKSRMGSATPLRDSCSSFPAPALRLK